MPVTWDILGVETIVKHPWCEVTDSDVLFSNGLRQIRTVFEDSGGVGILAITREGKLILVDLPRFAVRESSYLEIPGGGIHPNKTLLQTAKEEFLEETGLVAEVWERLFAIHRSPSITNNIHHIFLARGVREATAEEKSEITPDPEELINGIVYMEVEDAFEEIGRRIMDSVTVVALQWLHIQRLQGAA